MKESSLKGPYGLMDLSFIYPTREERYIEKFKEEELVSLVEEIKLLKVESEELKEVLRLELKECEEDTKELSSSVNTLHSLLLEDPKW